MATKSYPLKSSLIRQIVPDVELHRVTILVLPLIVQKLSRPAVPLEAPCSRPFVREKSPRVAAIDAARGTAMLFVCLAHFAVAYLWPLNANGVAFLTVVGMIASPTFMTISGMTTGFLAETSPRSLPYLRRRLLDRGLFMLLAGRLILAVAFTVRGDSLSAAYRTSFITDPIAIAIMIGPRLVGSTKATVRAALAMWLYVLGWMLVWLWHPGSPLASTIKPYLVGTLERASSGQAITFPVVQWLAVYLMGTILGEHVGQIFRTNPSGARRPFLRVGATSTALALFAYFGGKRMVGVHAAALQTVTSLHLVTPTQKYPPGPVYLLFFGGAGLMLMWLVLLIEWRQLFPPLIRSLQQMGQASLFVYLLQGFVYAFLRRLELPYSVWWPLLYVASIVLLGAAAAAWCLIDGNRFLTIGVTALLERRAPWRAGDRRLAPTQQPVRAKPAL